MGLAVTEYAAGNVESGSAALVKAFESLPTEMQLLRPMDKCRSALDQIQECAFMNGFLAKVLATGQIPEFDRPAALAERQSHDTPEKALSYLRTRTESLVAAIRDFPEDKLTETIVLPFGPDGVTKTFAQIFEMPNWNMAYHEGQINYIKHLHDEA